MLKNLLRQLGIYPSEASLVLVLGGILFANYAAMGITKVVAVSGFISQVKDQYILLVWAVDMLLLTGSAALQAIVVDRFNRVRLMITILLIFTILYALLPLTFLFKLFPPVVNYTFIYLLNDQQWRLFPIVFWVLVTDIFEPAQARRLIPIIANFTFIGTILGLGVAAADPILGFGPVSLLYMNAVIFGLAFLAAWLRLRKMTIVHHTTKQDMDVKASFTEALGFVRSVPAFGFLAINMLAAGVLMTILLYHAIASANDNLDKGLFENFYALYNLSIAAGSIILQNLTRYLSNKLSLKNAFLLQPIIMTLGIIINLFIPGYWSGSTTQGVARINLDTFDLTSRKHIEALIPNQRRGRVSLLIDGHLPSLGTIIGSLITFTIISIALANGLTSQQTAWVYLGVGLLVGIVAIYSGLKIRATYEDSLLSWQLKRRIKAASIIDRLNYKQDE